MIDSKLVRHYHIHIVRYSARHPVMSANRLQPPDFIPVLKSNSVHFISSVLLQKASQTLHAFSGTANIWQDNINNTLFSDSTCGFFFSILCRLINNQWVCAQYTRIGSDRLCGSHSDIRFIHTTCSPDTLTFQGIRHGCISHRVIRQFNLHMGNLGFIFTRLLLRMNHNKFLRSKMPGTGIIVSRDHCRTIIGCFLTN